MSDASRSSKGDAGRALRPDEVTLLRRLLGRERTSLLAGAIVADMSDGGMGSIRFAPFGDTRSARSTLANARFTDADGMPVSVALHADDQGRLYELDVWKVDFSPLIRYPEPAEISILPPPVESSQSQHLPHPA